MNTDNNISDQLSIDSCIVSDDPQESEELTLWDKVSDGGILAGASVYLAAVGVVHSYVKPSLFPMLVNDGVRGAKQEDGTRDYMNGAEYFIWGSVLTGMAGSFTHMGYQMVTDPYNAFSYLGPVSMVAFESVRLSRLFKRDSQD